MTAARALAALALAGGAVASVVLLSRYGKREYERQRALERRPRRRGTRLADVDGGKDVLRTMPDRWWTRRVPRDAKLCYATKTDAMNVFRSWNQQVIDAYGGETAGGSRGEFDAMTKYGALPHNIAEALWLALPPERHSRRGFCLEDIDVEALNETSPGRQGSGFMLPEYVSESLIDRQYEEHYRRGATRPRPPLRGRAA